MNIASLYLLVQIPADEGPGIWELFLGASPAVVALAITDQNLSVPASVGFIALFGIALENGMVLVAYLNQLIREGSTFPIRKTDTLVSFRLMIRPGGVRKLPFVLRWSMSRLNHYVMVRFAGWVHRLNSAKVPPV